MKISKPLAPREEILADGRYVLAAEHASGHVLVVYDPERCAAGVYHVEQELWRLQVPVSLHEFLTGLQTNGFRLPDGADLQTWLDAVTELAGATRN